MQRLFLTIFSTTSSTYIYVSRWMFSQVDFRLLYSSDVFRPPKNLKINYLSLVAFKVYIFYEIFVHYERLKRLQCFLWVTFQSFFSIMQIRSKPNRYQLCMFTKELWNTFHYFLYILLNNRGNNSKSIYALRICHLIVDENYTEKEYMYTL